MPEWPCRTAVRSPPTAAATTGVPHACASIATRPKDSEYEGTITSVAARYHCASSRCGHGGSSRTSPVRPSRAASSVRPSGSCRPVPLGPPTKATVSRPARVIGYQLRGCVQHHVGSLERLYPAGEDEHDAVGRQAELRPGMRLRSGLEHREVNARINGDDARRVGGVVPDELPCLIVGIGNQPVGRGNDLRLAAQPDLWLNGVAGREGGVLDLAQRVHGLDERDSPPLLGDGADLARQPVMPVHEVIPAGRMRSLGPEQLEGELAQLARKI